MIKNSTQLSWNWHNSDQMCYIKSTL